jgi:hypothetical protein
LFHRSTVFGGPYASSSVSNDLGPLIPSTLTIFQYAWPSALHAPHRERSAMARSPILISVPVTPAISGVYGNANATSARSGSVLHSQHHGESACALAANPVGRRYRFFARSRGSALLDRHDGYAVAVNSR